MSLVNGTLVKGKWLFVILGNLAGEGKVVDEINKTLKYWWSVINPKSQSLRAASLVTTLNQHFSMLKQ